MSDNTYNLTQFTHSEAKLLKELTSFDFGFLKFSSPKGQLKKKVLEKAIVTLDTKLSDIVRSIKEEKETEETKLKENNSFNSESEIDLFEKYSALLLDKVDPDIYLFLGHYQLLLHLYEDALSAYLEFEARKTDNWNNIQFLYGLSICYFHFNAFDKAIELFQTILYLQPGCIRAKEIHIRLGYIYKLNTNFEPSLKHFRNALNDISNGSFTETEIRFQIAHLLEVCGKYKQAEKAYNQLIESININNSSIKPEENDNTKSNNSTTSINNHIKHLCFRQLSWLYFSERIKTQNNNSLLAIANQIKDNSNSNNTTNNNNNSAIVVNLLQQAISLDDSSGKTWYLYGRAQAKENKVQEAFMAYRNSIDKTEANADTWCSIGVLYQEQNQPMDALQAYFCACQLNRKHVAAWTNLGLLYESMGQHSEAYKCYKNAISADDKQNEVRSEIKDRVLLLQNLLETNKSSLPSNNLHSNMNNSNMNKSNQQMVNQLQHHPHQSMQQLLPTVDEAWNLPIPTELTQRQIQIELQQQINANSTPSSNPTNQNSMSLLSSNDNQARRMCGSGLTNQNLSRLYAHQIPPYLPQQQQQQPQQQVQTNCQEQVNSSMSNNTNNASLENDAKRRKLDSESGNGNSSNFCIPQNSPSIPITSNQVTPTTGSSIDSNNLLMLPFPDSKPIKTENIESNSNTISDKTSTNNNQTLNKNTSNNQNPENSQIANQTNTQNTTTNQLPEDFNLLDEMTVDYDEELFNIDALLNDPMNNFDENFGDYSNIVKENGANCDSKINNKKSDIKHEPHVQHQKPKIEENQPVPDLLNYLKTIDESDQQLITSPHGSRNPMDEFDIRMSGKMVMEKISKLTLLSSVFRDTSNGDENDEDDSSSKIPRYRWSITYLPGGRVPKLPQPPPLVSTGHSASGVVPLGSSCAAHNPSPISSSSSSSSKTTPASPSSSLHNHLHQPTPSLPPPSHPPHQPPQQQQHQQDHFQLSPPTPSIYLDNKKDVYSPELRHFCLSQPVVVIRNLAAVLRMDLGVFSTKSLVDANPTHRIEQRIQDMQAPDENRDAAGKIVMRCISSRSSCTIQEYAIYQARMFVEAKKEEKLQQHHASGYNFGTNNNSNSTSLFNIDLLEDPAKPSKSVKTNTNDSNQGSGANKKRKKIYFGTNCDLSDETKWLLQLHELHKLPAFLKVVSACNMLSHAGFTIQGMNSVQLYMKVPGCRTPGHQENNNFCSVNINVGPGDCEWFCVPEQYWGAIALLCREHNIDYLSGSWWPNLDELRQRQIPCYRFIQRPGDLVWINSGTVHWVQSIGWCNNIAWNVGPLLARQYSLAMERYEYNKLTSYPSIVPMIHLSWQIAKGIKMTDSQLYQLLRYTLLVSLVESALVSDHLDKFQVTKLYQPREENEPVQNCQDCETELFNIFLINQQQSPTSQKQSGSTLLSSPNSKQQGNTNNSSKSAVKYETRCLSCALKLSNNLSLFKAIYQYKNSELIDAFDNFKFQSTPIAAYSVSR